MKVEREKSFATHWISFKCRQFVCNFCFICMENAKENHCSSKHLLKNFCDLSKSADQNSSQRWIFFDKVADINIPLTADA